MKTSVRSLLVALGLAAVLAAAALPVAGPVKKDKAVETFELYKDSANELRFRLKDEDGDLLAASGKLYETKAECRKVIDPIKTSAAKATVDDRTK
jgi:uncharacterized protein YegP (UPF0339 family)